jgi:hypothetical protein
MGDQRSGPEPQNSGLAISVKHRYVDAYRVADTIDWFGRAIKKVGAVLACVIFIGAAESLHSAGAGVVGALLVGSVFFVIGVIVAAQGQMLRAMIDTAVNSSPFLSDPEKAASMSLPTLNSGHGGATEGSRPSFSMLHSTTTEVPPSLHREDKKPSSSSVCRHCGAAVSLGTVCMVCGQGLY